MEKVLASSKEDRENNGHKRIVERTSCIATNRKAIQGGGI
jgi:hypothetical protein